MPRSSRFFPPLLLGLAALGASPSSVGVESENLRQLQAMPRERRVALSENLTRFDKLPPLEQDAIRKLDAEIARQDPTAQARYRSVLRRYHLWVNGLTEDEKAQLQAAESTEARFNLARKFRSKEIEAGATGSKIYGIRTGDFGMRGPYEVAYLLRIWKRLTDQERAEIERKTQPRKKLIDEIKGFHKAKGVTSHTLPEAEEQRYIDNLARNEAFKRDLGQPKTKAAPRPDEPRYAEFLYFEEFKPKAVRQDNLERFTASCPNWLHEMLDPLSPDDARAYLTILYRLLYPSPDEMPAESKSAKPSTTPKPSAPKAGATKSGPF